MTTESPTHGWKEFYQRAAQKGFELLWPNETLVRLLKGKYIPGLNRDYAEKRVLEVGCGNGNNLLFLATLGLELSATEIADEICEATRQKLQQFGVNAMIKTGRNRSLPFDSNSFDLLVSWNVIHYEDNETAMREAIAEYARVLNPGGRFLLSTTGPEHLILKDSRTLGGHRYQIGREDDFRKGQVFFYFDAPNYVQHYFGQSFREVMVGRAHDTLFSAVQDYWIVTGLK